jgi:hypothetical protein
MLDFKALSRKFFLYDGDICLLISLNFEPWNDPAG